MKTNFESFKVIKKVIQQNNRRITKFTDLACLYLGFCTHFISYITAYEVLFNQKNYYACHAIDRIVLDLYIKSRLLAEVENPSDLADWFWRGKEIKKYPKFTVIKGDLTDIKLCKYFDQEESIRLKKLEEQGIRLKKFEEQYRKMSNFIHPTKQAALEYWKKHKWANQEKSLLQSIEEEKSNDFKMLASEVHAQLTNVYLKILKETNLELNESEKK